MSEQNKTVEQLASEYVLKNVDPSQQLESSDETNASCFIAGYNSRNDEVEKLKEKCAAYEKVLKRYAFANFYEGQIFDWTRPDDGKEAREVLEKYK